MKTHPLTRFVAARILPLLMLAFGAAAFAQTPADPPARVGSLSLIEGSVAFAPPGETEWTDAAPNRPVTGGDRLWTDRGGRAEVHLGSAVLHVDSETFLDMTAIDDDVVQASLNEGTVSARVRELRAGENFEIDTPQLAFRASQPGDYRIDVDPRQGTTRVTVRYGAALVYGANGQAQQLDGAQVVTFAGRDLERLGVQASLPGDGFDRWAADRNRAEDESVAARYIPREVVGYQQLDPYGSWAQDPSYGTVWYPRVTIADWAPYRYGHWEFIVPWGWTWIDDAPWGFAPFHYGRWAMIGSRWAWCPGRIDRRPVYSPALVAFVGGGSGVSFSLTIGSGPGIGWFPLAPGEAWRPAYRASPIYLANVNRHVVVDGRAPRQDYANRHRPAAVTAVSMEDFSRGRPVHRHWQPVNAADLGRVQVQAQPALPRPSRFVENRPVRSHALPPPPLAVSPAAVQPRGAMPDAGPARRDFGENRRPPVAPRPREQRAQERPFQQPSGQQERLERDQQVQQERAQRESQIQQQRAQREQQVQIQQERAQRESQVQQQRAQREQERQQREQDRARRDQQGLQERTQREQQLQSQRDQAMRQQQAAQEQAARHQQAQERATRQQQAAQEQAARQQQAQERAMRQQQAAQEQAARQQQAQERAMRQAPPQAVTPEQAPAQPAREGRGRGRQAPEQRDDNRSQGPDEGWRGRGHGRAG